MIKYRPHRGSLEDAMKEAREFVSIDEIYTHILDDWNSSGFGELFDKEDLCVSESLGEDERAGLKDFRYVCTSRMVSETYSQPQCIGMCSIE